MTTTTSSLSVASWLLGKAKDFHINAAPSTILALSTDDNEAFFWISVQTLKFIWDKRTLNKRTTVLELLAHLRDCNNILEDSIYSTLANEIIQYL